jgi:hypothetical protein
MKKGIFLVLMILGVMTVSSVKAQFSVGPGVVYGTNIETVGIDGVVHYAFPNKFGLMAGYTYFFEKDHVTWSAIDVDATYDIYSMGDRGSVYALAGVDFLHSKVQVLGVNVTGNDTGVNVGAGWRIGISGAMSLVPEVRYTFGGGDFLRVGVKLMFGLGASR